MQTAAIEKAYAVAKERYAELGVDTDKALEKLRQIAISMHCWQGDDCAGNEAVGDMAASGIMATGNYPGRARNAVELRADAEEAMRLIPGKHRFSIHAFYRETDGKKVDRDAIELCHFQNWIDWAKKLGIALDFNSTFFAHPKAAEGFTLAHRDPAVRKFWVDHTILCRRIAAEMGKAQGSACVTNHWIPDGMKDVTIDRKKPREWLVESLDAAFAEKIDPKYNLDSVESKLFGIGSETYVVGSHEFYMGYAMSRKKLLTLDAGHYHPTETLADKISAILCFVDEMLLHVSRGIRWDSDHVVILNDDLRATAEELVRGDYLNRVHIGLDFFDASINRIGAWVIGVRAMIKALLIALVEPTKTLREMEMAGNYTGRLAMTEEIKTLPYGDVWNYYCMKQNVPIGMAWMDDVKKYEANVTSKR